MQLSNCIAPFLLVVVGSVASAATITIPSTVVNGTDVFSGPALTLTSTVQPTDTLTLTARGEVFLQSGPAYGTNAAGVVTTAGSTGVGGTSPNGSTNFGALLIGNPTLGFFQIFPANIANGLSSATPPSLLTTNLTFGSLGFGSAIPSGTVLQLRVSDINTVDNSGSFTVFGQINVASGVPEPASWLLVGGGIGVIAFVSRKRLCSQSRGVL
ncbi:MAG: hypothetical protein JWO19_3904 [Bryobacterales bacterium]|jgi:hypothetical protein|nr:hypothetical protein [Bryobacterales bacterium]